MKLQHLQSVPVAITAGVVAVVCGLHLLPRALPKLDAFERLEWMTYDWRVRAAFKHPAPIATNLGAVFIDDSSLRVINDHYRFTWPWPRSVFGWAVQELAAQGARVVGFDVLFDQLHPDTLETRVLVEEGEALSADEFFARELARASNVVLAVFGQRYGGDWRALPPAPLFATNALALGHAVSEKDSDGVLRKATAFKRDPEGRVFWHLGIILAAQALGADLSEAEIRPDRIILRAANGVERVLPVDREGRFYIDWSLSWHDPRLTTERIEELLDTGTRRGFGEPPAEAKWKDKLVVVGSIGAGNNISDLGSTPLSRETYLVGKHWNVANAILTGRFVRASSTPAGLLLIAALGALSAGLTWKLRAPWPSLWVVLLGAAYTGLALTLYVQHRYWLPLVMPVFGGLVLTHVATVTYQALFEQREKRRVKTVFARLVSPDVVNELLQAESLHLGGSRRMVTVFFADVRGFTEMTDVNQARTEEYVRQHGLSGAAAEAYFDTQARETLGTVNTYLAAIADQIKRHKGTLDKYIGDCVMAFWGAPVANEQHARCCVRAAIDAQRAIYALNQERFAENKRREAENAARSAAGQPPLPALPLLSLGTGINTGWVVVGLMGSDAHILNYTVFGRDVNLASRLEGVSGRGRIIIGEATYLELLRDDPALAATCKELAPVTVKGIQKPVKIYEVPWKEAAETPPLAPAQGTPATARA